MQARFGVITSGVAGHPVEHGPAAEARLARWLNDEWQMLTEDEILDFNMDARRIRIPDLPDDDDVPARNAIIGEFLPLLREAYRNWDDPEVSRTDLGGMSKAAQNRRVAGLKRILPRYAELQKKLVDYPLVPLLRSADLSAFRLISETTEGWAAHILLNMARERRLGRLRRCLEGSCQRWFIARRENDKFCHTKCRVRHHQSDPQFKARRNKLARENYQVQLGLNAVVKGKGWKKRRPVAEPRGQQERKTK